MWRSVSHFFKNNTVIKIHCYTYYRKRKDTGYSPMRQLPNTLVLGLKNIPGKKMCYIVVSG